jgi:hypothetical protein
MTTITQSSSIFLYAASALAAWFMHASSALPIFLILFVSLLIYDRSPGSTLTLFIAAAIVVLLLRPEYIAIGMLAWCTGLAILVMGAGWPARETVCRQLPIWATLVLAVFAIGGSVWLMPAVGTFLGVTLIGRGATWFVRENMKGSCPTCRKTISIAAEYRRCSKCGNPFVILDGRWLSVRQAIEEVPLLPNEIAEGVAWTIEERKREWRKETWREVMRSSKIDVFTPLLAALCSLLALRLAPARVLTFASLTTVQQSLVIIGFLLIWIFTCWSEVHRVAEAMYNKLRYTSGNLFQRSFDVSNDGRAFFRISRFETEPTIRSDIFKLNRRIAPQFTPHGLYLISEDGARWWLPATLLSHGVARRRLDVLMQVTNAWHFG